MTQVSAQDSYDLIILGSGAAGMTTALVAAGEGLKVLVLEKTRWIGGTSAFSGGAPWLPGNPLIDGHEGEAGEADHEAAETYLRAVLGNEYDAERSKAYIRAARPMYDYVKKHGVDFIPVKLPDYTPDAPGARAGRIVSSAELDGRNLKPELLARIRPQMKQLTILGGMQIASGDVPFLRNTFRSAKAFRYVTKLVLRYASDLLLHGRTTRLMAGRALVARLLSAADRLGVTVWTNAVTKDLVMEAGAVKGVIVRHGGVTHTLKATKGVVMATGGFGANKEMRQRLVANKSGWNVQPEGNTGDGIALGQKAGAKFVDNNRTNALNMPVSARRESDGSLTVFPHFAFDRHLPGSIVVGPDGKRFFNEARDYQKFVYAMHEHGIDHCWLIGDAEFVGRYGMGLVRPWPFPLGHHIASGYLKMGKTIEELADVLHVDPVALASTLTSFNKHAVEGRDPEFKRGEDGYSRYMGDATAKPSTTVGPLLKAPFYAIELRPGDISTFAGLETDADARALDAGRNVIPGLYVVGLDMNPVGRGDYPSGGFGLGPGMTFGYRAAMHAARN